MRYIEGVCKKCKTSIKFDIGNMTEAEAHEKIKSIQLYECPGMHVYIAGIWDHYDWSNVVEVKDDVNLGMW